VHHFTNAKASFGCLQIKLTAMRAAGATGEVLNCFYLLPLQETARTRTHTSPPSLKLLHLGCFTVLVLLLK
jgi:hypothetical protein